MKAKRDFRVLYSKFLETASEVVESIKEEYKDNIAHIELSTPTTISGAPFRNEIYIIVQRYGEDPKSYCVGYIVVYPYASDEWISNVRLFKLSEIRPSIYSTLEGLVTRKIVKELVNRLEGGKNEHS